MNREEIRSDRALARDTVSGVAVWFQVANHIKAETVQRTGSSASGNNDKRAESKVIDNLAMG